MTKFSLSNKKAAVVRSSLRLPSAMVVCIHENMKSNGFNLKQRASWIESVTEEFLSRPDTANLIAEEFISPGTTESIPISISSNLDEKIKQALENVQSEEGVEKNRSAVIRTAIIQRLLLAAGMQLTIKG